MEDENTPNYYEIYCKRLSAFLLEYFLPISMTLAVIFGALVPVPGAALDHEATQYVCMGIIFLTRGLFLHTEEMKEVFVSYKASVFGVISILALTSVTGGQLTLLLDFSSAPHDENKNFTEVVNKTLEGRLSSLGPPEYQFGLISASNLAAILCGFPFMI